MQSPELTKFYQAYAKWVEDGAPSHDHFTRSNGLCGNVAYDPLLGVEMRAQFAHKGFQYIRGWGFLPFNTSTQAYGQECSTATAHLNPLRIKWVRDHCNPQD